FPAYRSAENFAENSRRGGCQAEIAEKHRMTPVHHAGNDQAIDVAENFLERLAVFGRLRRKLRTNCAGSRHCGIRRDAQRLDIFAKIRDPVCELMQLFAEFLRRSVTERLWIFHRLCSRRSVGGTDQDMINTSAPLQLKSKAETEMEGAEIFACARIGIDAVIEANRAHRQLVAQARAYGVAHIVETNIFRRRQKITRISKYGALKFSKNRKGVFDIKHGKEFSADRMTMIIVGSKIAFAETAHGCSAAIEKTFVDRDGRRFAGTASCKRMDHPNARAE